MVVDEKGKTLIESDLVTSAHRRIGQNTVQAHTIIPEEQLRMVRVFGSLHFAAVCAGNVLYYSTNFIGSASLTIQNVMK